jgi:hypothetical protein
VTCKSSRGVSGNALLWPDGVSGRCETGLSQWAAIGSRKADEPLWRLCTGRGRRAAGMFGFCSARALSNCTLPRKGGVLLDQFFSHGGTPHPRPLSLKTPSRGEGRKTADGGGGTFLVCTQKKSAVRNPSLKSGRNRKGKNAKRLRFHAGLDSQSGSPLFWCGPQKSPHPSSAPKKPKKSPAQMRGELMIGQRGISTGRRFPGRRRSIPSTTSDRRPGSRR